MLDQSASPTEMEIWDSLAEGVARGEYNLLLGAGASCDSLDRDGSPLPSGSQLAEELRQEFGFGEDAKAFRLPRIYEACKAVNPSHLAQVMRRRFLDCTPAPWYESLTSLNWAAIWNFNVDDVVTQAYAVYESTQTIVPVEYSARYVRHRPGSNDCQAVYLHGRVQRGHLEIPPDLVFDITEYVRAAARPNTWHRVFGDAFAGEPFLIVGASLAEEADIATVLRAGSAASRPSVIVRPSFTDFERLEVANWGLHCLEASSEDLFTELTRRVRPIRERIVAAIPGSGAGVPQQAMAFLNTFERIATVAAPDGEPKRDFYSGYDPEWAHIRGGLDAILPSTQQMLEAVVGQEDPVGVYCISGPAFTGKTTALMRICQDLATRNRGVFFHNGDERPDADAVIWWARREPGTVLAFDGMADFAPELSRIADRCSSQGVSLVILGTERKARMASIYGAFDPAVLHDPEALAMTHLSDADISVLVDKLSERNRLGKLTREGRGARIAHFAQEGGRSLFDGLSGLEAGRGFLSRFHDELGMLTTSSDRDLFALLSMAYSVGYSLPVGLLASTLGVETRDLRRALSQAPLADLAEITSGRRAKAKPLHRRLAREALTDPFISRTDLFRLTAELSRGLVLYVTRESIARRSLESRIAARLMDERILGGWIGRDRLEIWYQLFEEPKAWGWNARFWEQRALAASGNDEFDRAESFAEKSVDLFKDERTLNTLGTILFRKALGWPGLDDDARHALFWRAVRAVRESREQGEGRFPHPFVTFFSYSLRWPDHLDERLRGEWAGWMSVAQRSRVYRDPDFATRVENWQRDWLMKFTVPSDD